MSQGGSLVFYGTGGVNAPHETLAAIIRAARPEVILESFRSQGEQTAWTDLMHDKSSSPDEMLPRVESAEEVAGYYKDGTRLYVRLNRAEMGLRIAGAVRSGVTERIRGDFCPSDMTIQIGYHDIFYEDIEHGKAVLVARCFLSIGFFGYSTPNDWEECRRLVLALPEVGTIRGELELLAGPLATCIYWSG